MNKIYLGIMVLLLSSCASHIETTKSYGVAWSGHISSKDSNGKCYDKNMTVSYKTISTSLGELQSPQTEVIEKSIECNEMKEMNNVIPRVYVDKISTIEEPGKCSDIFKSGDLESISSVVKKYGQEVELKQVISCMDKGE